MLWLTNTCINQDASLQAQLQCDLELIWSRNTMSSVAEESYAWMQALRYAKHLLARIPLPWKPVIKLFEFLITVTAIKNEITFVPVSRWKLWPLEFLGWIFFYTSICHLSEQILTQMVQYTLKRKCNGGFHLKKDTVITQATRLFCEGIWSPGRAWEPVRGIEVPQTLRLFVHWAEHRLSNYPQVSVHSYEL